MVDTILFPSSFFDVRRVDEDLQAEYDAVLNTGLFDVILFGYEQWFERQKLVLTKEPSEKTYAVYRGWMMKPELYEMFYGELEKRQICLVTNPEEYDNMHVFPNVYKWVAHDTARMKVFALHEEIDIEGVKKEFARFMVKDYVKSVKGTEFPRYFDHTVDQESFNQWMEVFYKYRGNLLTGGICIKEYLDLKQYGDRTNADRTNEFQTNMSRTDTPRTNEFRVFYINHEIATVTRNSGQMQTTAEPPKALIGKYRNLPSIFYTIDFAELTDGTWKIIEAGDGGVSGLSDGQDYEAFFRALYHCFA